VNDHRDTIFALSSGQPPAAVAVIRISGPRAGQALEKMIGRIPEPRNAAFARVRDPQSGDVIDEALALWFPGPKSETGEDTAELHIHGGRAVIAATLAALGRLEGLRMAIGGEFTRRAFDNGKVDLTRVEGLADLIAAETEVQRRQAFGQMRGALGKQADRWRTDLTKALALVEAGIDFSDEGDVPDDLLAPIHQIVDRLIAEMSKVLADGKRGERVREGLVVAIAGPPNAGKSTLLNCLAQRDVAIVSPYAGTTRDVIELHLDLEGMPVTILDTAGFRQTSDPVEQEGIRRTLLRANHADLVLWLSEGRSENEFSQLPELNTQVWKIRTKIDLHERNSELNTCNFEISTKTGIGIQLLLDGLASFTSQFLSNPEPAIVSRARQLFALSKALEALQRASRAKQDEIIAEELRGCATALGRLTGRIDVEEVLDVIFLEFCIGK
jgi:tRNA modification GTPase